MYDEAQERMEREERAAAKARANAQAVEELSGVRVPTGEELAAKLEVLGDEVGRVPFETDEEWIAATAALKLLPGNWATCSSASRKQHLKEYLTFEELFRLLLVRAGQIHARLGVLLADGKPNVEKVQYCGRQLAIAQAAASEMANGLEHAMSLLAPAITAETFNDQANANDQANVGTDVKLHGPHGPGCQCDYPKNGAAAEEPLTEQMGR